MTKAFWAIPFLIFLALVALVLRQRGEKGGDELRVSGNIEVMEVRVSFRIPGRVEKVLVHEGDEVFQNQQIALLDAGELEREVALKSADKTITNSALKELESGFLPEEIAQAKAKRDQAQADFQRLETDYKRQQQLVQQEVISKREFDVSQTSYEVAKARLQEAEKVLALVEHGVREEKIEQARARVEQANELLALAEAHLSYSALTAPIGGVVLSKNIESGEYVMAGTPIVTIGNLRDMWFRAYINETDLGRVKLGQRVNVSVDTYPGKTYEGKVSFISPESEFTPKNVQTAEERVKLVYRIKISLLNSNGELKPGMPAEGIILLKNL